MGEKNSKTGIITFISKDGVKDHVICGVQELMLLTSIIVLLLRTWPLTFQLLREFLITGM